MDFTDKYLKWIILGVVGLVGLVLIIIGLNSCKNTYVITTTTAPTTRVTQTTTRVPTTQGTTVFTSNIDLNPMD